MRIVSLVPNATEIVFALGAGELLVGVSHECDFPPAARALPQLTGSALAAGLSPREVDAAVSAQLSSGASLYTLDEARLAELEPDLLLTQELCPVCAVSTAQVEGATVRLARCPEVISLDPKTLADVLADVLTVGRAIGRESEARALVSSLEARLSAVRARRNAAAELRVAALEWLDPPFTAGHWVPEMIAHAGGIDAFARAGDPSRRTSWSEIAAADPDVLVVMPCGFDEDGARRQLQGLADNAEWCALRAVRQGRVYPVDANGLFSRPGPRLIDGVERLAELLSPPPA